MAVLIFDIETCPQSDEELRAYCDPFDPKSLGDPPGEFDPSSVKCGNIGGPTSDKGKAKIEEARAAHQALKNGWSSRVAAEEAAYWARIKDRAALSPETARVAAIGWTEYGSEKINAVMSVPEKEMISGFWSRVNAAMLAGKEIIGFNSNHFDLPFLVRRSWILGIKVPMLFAYNNRLKPCFVDLLDVWKCGNYQDGIKLSRLATLLGVTGKWQDLDGSLFHQLLAIDQESAREYLVADVKLTEAVWLRLR
jgi:DNA polymerase elongation subunit (family B)